MKIMIMAAGAVGGYFGSVLSQKNEVTFIARGQHLENIQSKGLKIISETSGNYISKSPATSYPEHTYKPDLVLYCVKAYQNEQAIDLIRPFIGKDTTILSLQNGIGIGHQLEENFGVDKTLLGSAYIEASVDSPGVIIERGGLCQIRFGSPLGIISEKEQRISRLLNECSINHVLSKDISTDLWEKLIFISALSGMSCITRSTFQEIIGNKLGKQATESLLEETHSVALADGANISKHVVSEIMTHFIDQKSKLVSSMYKDMVDGKPMEVDVINGAVSKLGKKYGIPTPINDLIYAALNIHAQN
tara:strand:+ start:144 stop:1055 length:912 start_codon:yes stop_codon:yes gene_type:complete